MRRLLFSVFALFSNSRKSRRSPARNRRIRLGFESLEARELLSGAPMAAFDPVMISSPGSQSTPPNVAFNGTQVIRYIYLPVDRAGNPLTGPYNMWSGATANGLPGEAAARGAPGYIMEQTPYHVQAEQMLAPLNGAAPTRAQFEAAWYPTSRATMIDAVLSGTAVDSYGLNTHPNPGGTVQSLVEIPTLQTYGVIPPALGTGSAALNIRAASQTDNPAVQFVAVGGAAAETAGAVTYYEGVMTINPVLMQTGTKLMATGGGVAAAALSGYSFYQDVQQGDVVSAVRDALGTAAGLAAAGGNVPLAAAFGGGSLGIYAGQKLGDLIPTAPAGGAANSGANTNTSSQPSAEPYNGTAGAANSDSNSNSNSTASAPAAQPASANSNSSGPQVAPATTYMDAIPPVTAPPSLDLVPPFTNVQ